MDDRADAFFASFYQRFLEAPGIARLFERTDVTRQVQMLKKSVFQLVSFYVVGQPTAELERLASLHRNLGLSPGLFDAWMRALLETAAQYDPEFDEVTELAWCWALAPGIAYMQLAAHLPEAASAADD